MKHKSAVPSHRWYDIKCDNPNCGRTTPLSLEAGTICALIGFGFAAFLVFLGALARYLIEG